MKTGIKNLLKFLTFVFIVCFITLKLGDVFVLKRDATVVINAFHDLPKNSIDVLIVGNSSIMRAVSPMELWKSDGITSYNYSIAGGRIHAFYYWIQDALKTQKPKLVIMDPVTFFYEEARRFFVDYIEDFDIKFKMMNDPIYGETSFDKASILFPFIRYHDRWKEIEFEDLENIGKTYDCFYRGFLFSSKVQPNYKGNEYMKKSRDNVKMMDTYKEYLYKTIDLCKKNDIKVLILGVQDIRVWGPEESRQLNEIARETGVDFLDLNSIDYGLNWLQDTKDGGAHLNVLGGLKVTSYLSNYIRNNYDIPSRKGEKGYEFWDKDYLTYEKEKETALKVVNSRIKKLGLDSED